MYRRLIRRHVGSPAIIVACVSLVVALDGVSYAAVGSSRTRVWPSLATAATLLLVAATLAAAAPATTIAAVTATAEVEHGACCYGYGSTARDIVTVDGGPASDKVAIVSVQGGYEIHDPAGVTPSGNCAAVSETTARCERDADNASADQLRRPELRISGGLGDDELSAAGVAPDTSVSLSGGVGVDRLTGATGADVVHGGPGADLGLGGAGDDTFLDADEAADNYDGGDGFDAMHHDRATDFTGSLTTRRAAEDLLTSVEGLRGGVRDDRLTGSPGDDHLDGDAGDDRLSGRAGDDVLVDGAGDDVMRGGSGADVLHHRNGRDRADCGAGRRDRLLISTSQPVHFARCERSDVGGGYTDGKYEQARVAGTVGLDRIRRSSGALMIRAVCARGAECKVKLTLWRDERLLANRTASSGTIRLPLDRAARRILRTQRSLRITVRFVDAYLNEGGTANYVLDSA
jgi:RTX calcium-binding nonapeptide repeat (4 copies)